MTWSPSEGLKRSESVVQTILADAASVGIHITNPALRWRMVQVIADALDTALADGQGIGALPVRDVSMDDHFPAPNGTVDAALGELMQSGLVEVVEPAAKKRGRGGRGRPRGSRNKAKPTEANA